MCLSNNLCLNQDGAELISRGSCTDETWQSSECGQYCLDGKYLFRPNVGTSVHISPLYSLAR